jgi:hypothetical protein
LAFCPSARRLPCSAALRADSSDTQRHPGKVLKQHARDDEWNLFDPFAFGLPVRKFTRVVFDDLFTVAIAQHRLEHYAKTVRHS